jgi:hypothetical protein
MAQFALTYAPNLSGGAPANTTTTGSFYVGRLVQGRTWNQVVPQTTVNTLFYASPDDADGYLMALPKSGASPTQPQFYKSLLTGGIPSKTDGAFISTCSYILKTYQATGAVGQPPVNPAGCSSVPDCQTQFTATGWWQSYGFTAP